MRRLVQCAHTLEVLMQICTFKNTYYILDEKINLIYLYIIRKTKPNITSIHDF